MKRRRLVLKKGPRGFGAAVVITFLLHLTGGQAEAMPMFARRYGVACATCHTSPPRLNETGYRFRAAGFRMPEELESGAGRSSNITDYIGFRLQPRYTALRSSVGAESRTEHDANLFAAEGYFWYGPVSKHFSASLKLTIWPEESHETELNERLEGVLRFDYGSADNFIDIRAGVPHPLEGFGGSEAYSVSNTKPFIQELRTANFDQDTFFTTVGLHQMAVTAGYYHRRTTIRGYVSSGMRLDIDDEDGALEAFGRKEPFSKAFGRSGRGGPDLQLFFNQILHPDGGNVSAFYYKGQSFLPRLDLLGHHEGVPAAGPPPATRELVSSGLRRLKPPRAGRVPYSRRAASAVTDPFDESPRFSREELENVPFFENDFHRLAFYAGYPFKKVSLLYGVQYGRDTIGSGGHFGSLGQFAEGNVKVVNDLSVVGARFDWFDPARNKERNEMAGVTPYLNLWIRSQLRVAAEYQHLVFKRGALQPERKENVFQLRLYWVK